jgi:hypothetical protein
MAQCPLSGRSPNASITPDRVLEDTTIVRGQGPDAVDTTALTDATGVKMDA